MALIRGNGMYKILVIEDEKLICENIVELLELNHYQVRGVNSGWAGLEAVRTFQPDLILCDRMMDDLNGFQVLAALKAQPFSASIPFIFLTAMADRESIREGMDAGADDYVVKPFTADELLETVSVWVDYRRGLQLK
jgi:DNA-binding response OmpR family regulator